MTNPPEVKTTQLFSRRGINWLYTNRKALLEEGQAKLIEVLYKNRKKGEVIGQQTISYKLARSKAGQLGYGRLFGQLGSLETLSRECRGTLCKDYYHDIDMKNAQPVLLVQFARNRFGYELPEVKKYNDNRDAYLLQISPNREEAKEEVIRVFYGGKPTHEFLVPLYEEVNAFSKFLSHQPEFAELTTAVKNEKKNIYGTLLSYVLQTFERAVMLCMKKSFERQGWKVDILAYDGVMIRKDPSLDLNASLRNAEAEIEHEEHFRVTLMEKEMTAFEVPEEKEEIVPGVPKEDYNRMKEEFEVNHFYFVPTNQYAEMENGVVNLYDCDHAREYFKSKWRFCVGEGFEDFVEFFMLYRNDETRRTIKMIDYKEHPDDPSVFTPPLEFRWKMITAPTNPDLVNLYTTLLRINTGNDPVLYDYLLKYNAHMIQRPFELPGVSIVITGAKGTGKDTLYDFHIDYIFGIRFANNYLSNDQFFDKHDCGRENKFLVKLEEVDRTHCMKNSSTLKSLITASTSTFNPKGKKAYSTPNYTRYIFTTNKPNPVELSDGERRFVITACSAEKKGDFAFWNEIRTKLFTEEGGRTIAEYLLNIDLTDFNVRQLPTNMYQQHVVESEMSPEDRFVENWEGDELSTGDLYSRYRTYCVSNDLPYVNNAISLGRKMMKYVRDGVVVADQRHGNVKVYRKI